MRHINGFVRKSGRLATLTRADAIRREQTLSKSVVGVAGRMHDTRTEDTCHSKYVSCEKERMVRCISITFVCENLMQHSTNVALLGFACINVATRCSLTPRCVRFARKLVLPSFRQRSHASRHGGQSNAGCDRDAGNGPKPRANARFYPVLRGRSAELQRP